MTLHCTNSNVMKPSVLTVVVIVLGAILLTGCQSIDYRQATYSALRHEDCLRNEVETFCARSYHHEYYEYERMRNEFLRDTKPTSGTQQAWGNLSNNSTAL